MPLGMCLMAPCDFLLAIRAKVAIANAKFIEQIACSLSQPVLALLLEAARVHAFFFITFEIMLRWGSPTGRRPSCAFAAFVVLFDLQLSP